MFAVVVVRQQQRWSLPDRQVPSVGLVARAPIQTDLNEIPMERGAEMKYVDPGAA